MKSEQAKNILRDEHLELSHDMRQHQYGRRVLSPMIRCILWALRIYVVFMMVLIGYQFWMTVKIR